MTQKTAKDGMTPIHMAFSLDFNSKLDMKTINIIITKGYSRVPIYFGDRSNIIGFILVKNLIKCRPEDETPIRNLTIRKIPRIPEHMPLFDILNEFRKGHSHIAIVVKDAKDRSGSQTKWSRTPLDERIVDTGANGEFNSNSVAGINENSLAVDIFDGMKAETLVQNDPIAQNNVIGSFIPGLRTIDEQGGEEEFTATQNKNWERDGLDNTLEMDSKASPGSQPDMEVVGIITLEDVIEELLQEEIFDETDEYLDVHKKIRVRLRRSPLSSNFVCMSPTPTTLSPLASPCGYSPILRSPISPYLLSRGPIPILSVSPSRIAPYLHASASSKSNVGVWRSTPL